MSSTEMSTDTFIQILYFIHGVLSLLIALLLAGLNKKRFPKGDEEILQRDNEILQERGEKARLFKLLHKARKHKNNRKTNIFFLFLFNFSMPLVGYFFSIWIAYYLKTVSYEKKVANTNILNLDEFGVSFLKVERIFGEGSMIELMRNEFATKEKKLRALSSLANSPSPQNLRIIRETLSSSDDEIRMFGYSIINKAEKNLNTKINYYLDIFHDESAKLGDKNEEVLANAARNLAPLYWEMVYTELSHESLKESFLAEVHKYTEIAKKYYVPRMKLLYKQEKSLQTEELKAMQSSIDKYSTICVALFTLMGRVYMNQEKYELANTEFTIAQELSSGDTSYILPYLAEIYYLTGNYKVVNSILSSSKDLELNARLYPIIEQWRA